MDSVFNVQSAQPPFCCENGPKPLFHFKFFSELFGAEKIRKNGHDAYRDAHIFTAALREFGFYGTEHRHLAPFT